MCRTTSRRSPPQRHRHVAARRHGHVARRYPRGGRRWKVDAVYSGTQKCLGVPPGLSPVSFSRTRWSGSGPREPPQSWYLDRRLIAEYVGAERRYHHTAPISMVYALHAGLGVVLDEGLEASWARHRARRRAAAGGAAGARLPAVRGGSPPPRAHDRVAARRRRRRQAARRCSTSYDIEVGAGLGELAGKAGASASWATAPATNRSPPSSARSASSWVSRSAWQLPQSRLCEHRLAVVAELGDRLAGCRRGRGGFALPGGPCRWRGTSAGRAL